MTTKHAIAGTRFIANETQEKWHDETLWMVRAKRDKQSRSLPEWERLQIRHFIACPRVLPDARQYILFTAHFTLFFFHKSLNDSFAKAGNSRPFPHALAAL